MKCSKCDQDVQVLMPEYDVGIGGGACCLNEACEMFEKNVWPEYQDWAHVEEECRPESIRVRGER